MKIIGKVTEGRNGGATKFLAEVTAGEINVVMNNARYTEYDWAERVKVGSEFDLTEGHKVRDDIIKATSEMKGAWDKFIAASNSMRDFVSVVAPDEGKSS